jgi:hypothetical protein
MQAQHWMGQPDLAHLITGPQFGHNGPYLWRWRSPISFSTVAICKEIQVMRDAARPAALFVRFAVAEVMQHVSRALACSENGKHKVNG